MGWFAIVVAVLAVVHFAVNYQEFRRVLGFLGVGALALIGASVVFVMHADQQDGKRRQHARTLIKVHEVAISDATLDIFYNSLRAVVTNNSPFRLDRLVLRVVVRECSDPGCRVVGESTAANHSLDIPSGQRRQFNSYVSFSGLPTLRPGWSWTYSVETIEAGWR